MRWQDASGDPDSAHEVSKIYDITPEIWSKIDVFEIGARPQPANYYMNTHLFHTVEEGGALVVKAKGGAERPERVDLDYLDDAFFASQKEREIQRKLTVRNGEGKGLSFLITWSKSEPWKREGRNRAGEAPGSPNPPTNGYHAVGVDVRPLEAKPRGTVEVWEVPSESSSPLRVTVRH